MKIKWTDERPTEPGEYWLSIQPDSRLLDGAQWSRRETPADPFEEVTT